MPSTITAEAKAWLASLTKKKSGPQTLAERRAATDAWRKQDTVEARKLYPVNIEESSIAGVPSDVITPVATPETNRDRVLINLHGGGFVSDSGSLIEGVPIANLAKVKVVSVYYRLAPRRTHSRPGSMTWSQFIKNCSSATGRATSACLARPREQS
jgi:monoterpene epsilon-lactone hydrolase